MEYLQYTDGHGDDRLKYVISYMNFSYMCLIYIYTYIYISVCVYVSA